MSHLPCFQPRSAAKVELGARFMPKDWHFASHDELRMGVIRCNEYRRDGIQQQKAQRRPWPKCFPSCKLFGGIRSRPDLTAAGSRSKKCRTRRYTSFRSSSRLESTASGAQSPTWRLLHGSRSTALPGTGVWASAESVREDWNEQEPSTIPKTAPRFS